MVVNNNLLFFCFAILFVGFVYFNFNSDPSGNLIAEEIYFPPRQTDIYRLKSDKAKFTIINYMSLDCPHCRVLYNNETNKIDNYKDKINLVYRHNPLRSQPLSAEKALISECLLIQTNTQILFSFWQDFYTNYLESNDNQWVIQKAKKYISKEKEFEVCLESEDMKEKINQSKLEATLSGIVYTPTILVFKNDVFIEKIENVNQVILDKAYGFYLSK